MLGSMSVISSPSATWRLATGIFNIFENKFRANLIPHETRETHKKNKLLEISFRVFSWAHYFFDILLKEYTNDMHNIIKNFSVEK